MTTKVLGIDLHDAGRDGLYGVDPDDPITLIDDAARAGLPVIRADLRECNDAATLRQRISAAAGMPDTAAESWEALDRALHSAHGEAQGHVLLFDHADAFFQAAAAEYARASEQLKTLAREWHERGVPFFVFMVFPDHETRNAAIDA